MNKPVGGGGGERRGEEQRRRDDGNSLVAAGGFPLMVVVVVAEPSATLEGSVELAFGERQTQTDKHAGLCQTHL